MTPTSPTAPWLNQWHELSLDAPGPAICALPDWAVLMVAGADAAAFLQGQTTCDVLALTPGASGCGAFCTPKGRVIANFRLTRVDDGFLVWLSAGLSDAVHQRLRMFVLRSRVSIEPLERAVLGAWGPAIGDLLRAAGADLAACPDAGGYGSSDGGGGPGREDDLGRYMLAEGRGKAGLLATLISCAQPVHPDAWRLRDIAAGFPLVLPATREEFLPQMLNLDTLGGISFKKGCYTGQEIVTRTHFLGQLKRRMYRLRSASPSPLEPGAAIFDAGNAEPTPAGQIVNACRDADGHWECLAVLIQELADSPALRAIDPQGPLLVRQPLPYSPGKPA